jgi:hypothetical protein
MEHLELEAEMAGMDQLEQRLFARTKMLGGGGGLVGKKRSGMVDQKSLLGLQRNRPATF